MIIIYIIPYEGKVRCICNDLNRLRNKNTRRPSLGEALLLHLMLPFLDSNVQYTYKRSLILIHPKVFFGDKIVSGHFLQLSL